MRFDGRGAAARGLKSAEERTARGPGDQPATKQEPFRALREAAADADAMIALLPHADEPPEDVALLLAPAPPTPLARASTALPPEPASVPAARRFVSAVVTAWGYPDLAERTEIPVSELLTNAVRHARRPVELRLHRTRREVVVEISDDDPHAPRPRTADPEDENGRGLMLVDALADAWGTRLTGSGKTVWFSLRLQV